MQAKQIDRENRIVESYMNASEQFLREIEKRVETTRHYRHDLNNYIQMLEFLMEKEGESETVRNYIQEQKETYVKLNEQKLCDDEFLNTMIQIKKEECIQKDIKFCVKVEHTDYSGMEEMDKICLFMNLLDNAIEATEKVAEVDERVIQMIVDKKADKLQIYMQNPMQLKEPFSFHTSKTDKENHGIGNIIITKIINKYHGERKTEVDEVNKLFKDHISCQLKWEEEV